MTHHKFVQSCRQVQPLCNSHGLKHTVYVPQASLSEVLQQFFNCLQTYQVKHTPNTRTYIFFEIGVVTVICFTVC